MKNTAIVISLCLNAALAFALYTSLPQDGPADVGFRFINAIKSENYPLAQSFISEGKQDEFPKESLEGINELTGGSTSFKTYELLEFDNGNMVLLNLTPDGNFKIQGISIIGEDSQYIFSHE